MWLVDPRLLSLAVDPGTVESDGSTPSACARALVGNVDQLSVDEYFKFEVFAAQETQIFAVAFPKLGTAHLETYRQFVDGIICEAVLALLASAEICSQVQ